MQALIRGSFKTQLSTYNGIEKEFQIDFGERRKIKTVFILAPVRYQKNYFGNTVIMMGDDSSYLSSALDTVKVGIYDTGIYHLEELG